MGRFVYMKGDRWHVEVLRMMGLFDVGDVSCLMWRSECVRLRGGLLI